MIRRDFINPPDFFPRQTLKKAGEKQIASQTPEPWASGAYGL